MSSLPGGKDHQQRKLCIEGTAYGGFSAEIHQKTSKLKASKSTFR
jgi:hypothetical protein